MGAILEEYLVMHPAQPSEARLGNVNVIFRHIQIVTRLLQGYLFKVTMYTACTYKLKRKPLFDGLGLGVLNI